MDTGRRALRSLALFGNPAPTPGLSSLSRELMEQGFGQRTAVAGMSFGNQGFDRAYKPGLGDDEWQPGMPLLSGAMGSMAGFPFDQPRYLIFGAPQMYLGLPPDIDNGAMPPWLQLNQDGPGWGGSSGGSSESTVGGRTSIFIATLTSASSIASGTSTYQWAYIFEEKLMVLGGPGATGPSNDWYEVADHPEPRTGYAISLMEHNWSGGAGDWGYGIDLDDATVTLSPQPLQTPSKAVIAEVPKQGDGVSYVILAVLNDIQSECDDPGVDGGTWDSVVDTIKLRRFDTTSSEPTAGDFAEGEVAFNSADGRLWMKTPGGTMREARPWLSSTSRLLGRTTAGAGTAEEVTVGNGVEFSGGGLRRSALTGDVTASAGSGTTSFRTASARSVIGTAGATSAVPGDIVASADGQVLRRSGGTLAFGALDSTSSSAITPPGSDTYVIFNDGGVFGASSGFTFDKTNKRLILNGGPNATIGVKTPAGQVGVSVKQTTTGSGNFGEGLYSDGSYAWRFDAWGPLLMGGNAVYSAGIWDSNSYCQVEFASTYIKLRVGTQFAPEERVNIDSNGMQVTGKVTADGKYVNRGLSTNTADSSAVASTTTETNLDQNYTVPASLLNSAGRTIRVTATGIVGSTGTPNLTLRLKAGSTTLWSSGALRCSGTSGKRWTMQWLVTCRSTGASGSLNTVAVQAVIDATTANVPATAATVDLTSSFTLQVSAEWSASSASNTTKIESLVVEAINC